MSNSYFETKRMRDIIERSEGKLSFNELDLIENRLHETLYLAQIYQKSSMVAMTALDYKNTYNIFYVICMPDFGKSIQPQRITLAKKYVNQVKSGEVILEELIDELLFVNHVI